MSIEVTPPSCNTGVENTMYSRLVSLIDWVSVTFHHIGPVEDLLSILGFKFSSFRDLQSGSFGYLSGMTFEHCTLFYGTPPGATDMGQHLVLSGQGCRWVESNIQDFSWFDWLNSIKGLGGKFSRLDLAIDDYVRSIDLDNVKRCIISGSVVSHFRSARDLQSYKLDDGSTTGRTIYFGQPSSDIQFRFYDKRSERIQKGYMDVPDFYNRYEIQLSRDRADAAVVGLLDGFSVSGLCLGLFKNNLSFRQKTADSNKSRWPVLPWWSDFLSGVSAVKLYVPSSALTIPQKMDWLGRQASMSIRVVSEALGDRQLFNDYLTAMAEGRDLSTQDELTISNFKNDNGLRYRALDNLISVLCDSDLPNKRRNRSTAEQSRTD